METIINVMCFLNRVEFYNDDEYEDYKSFHNIRKVIVDEFANYVTDILNLFDILRLVIESQDDDRILDVDIDS